MLNKSLVIAALTASVAAADPKAAPAKAAPAKAAPAKVVAKANDVWEDILGRDLCDDYGTNRWEEAAAALKKAETAITDNQTLVDASKVQHEKDFRAWQEAMAAQSGRKVAVVEKAAAKEVIKDGVVTLATDKVAKYDVVVGTKDNEDKLKDAQGYMTSAETLLKKLYLPAPAAAVDNRDTKYNEVIAAAVKGQEVAQADWKQTTVAATVNATSQKATVTDLKAQSDLVITLVTAMQTQLKKVRGMESNLAQMNLAIEAQNKASIPTGLDDDLTTALAKQWTATDTLNEENVNNADLVAQNTQVSYLFRVVRRLLATQWAATCESTTNRTLHPLCQKTETARDASTSTWTWNANYKCDTTGTVAVCQMRGLRNLPQPTFGNTLQQNPIQGLITIVDGIIGNNDSVTMRTPIADSQIDASQTGLYDALLTAQKNYNNKVYIAIDKWGKLQESYITAAAFNLACWAKRTTGSYVTGDFSTWCVPVDLSAQDEPAKQVVAMASYHAGTKKYFHPLLNMIQTADAGGNSDHAARNQANVQIAIKTGAGSGVLNDWRVADKVVRVDLTTGTTLRDKYVLAQMKLWYAIWIRRALDAEEKYVADELTKSNTAKASADNNATTQYDNTKTDALRTWATWSAANTATKITDYKAAATFTNAEKDLKQGMKILKDLATEGTTLDTKDTAWSGGASGSAAAGAYKIYKDALDKFNANKAPTADFTANNTSLPVATKVPWVDAGVFTGATTNVMALVTLSKTENANAIAALALQKSYQLEQTRAAKAKYDAINLTHDKNLKALKKAKEDKIKFTAEVKAATEGCHREAFKDAQEDRKKKEAADKKIADAQKAMEAAYKKASAFPADAAGAVQKGGLCQKDAKTAARVPCAKGATDADALCCGAAQRFLKDGTKLVVETCQLATATTYLFYPEMKTGALKAPTPETWRFQCISAAQKLAAAATAALAAGYMMA